MELEYFWGLYFNELVIVGVLVFAVCAYAIVELFCGTTWQYPSRAEAEAEWGPRNNTDEEDPSIVGLGPHADRASELSAKAEATIRPPDRTGVCRRPSRH